MDNKQLQKKVEELEIQVKFLIKFLDMSLEALEIANQVLQVQELEAMQLELSPGTELVQ